MGQSEQGCPDETTRTGLSAQNKKERTTEKDSQKRTARTGQPEQFSQNKQQEQQPGQGKQTGQTELDCQHSTVKIVLLG
jgi:hypothetical protein